MLSTSTSPQALRWPEQTCIVVETAFECAAKHVRMTVLCTPASEPINGLRIAMARHDDSARPGSNSCCGSQSPQLSALERLCLSLAFEPQARQTPSTSHDGMRQTRAHAFHMDGDFM